MIVGGLEVSRVLAVNDACVLRCPGVYPTILVTIRLEELHRIFHSELLVDSLYFLSKCNIAFDNHRLNTLVALDDHSNGVLLEGLCRVALLLKYARTSHAALIVFRRQCNDHSDVWKGGSGRYGGGRA